MSERCGLWLEAGDYETFCMKQPDHDGSCQADRKELLDHVHGLEEHAQAVRRYIALGDALNDWPTPATTNAERSSPEVGPSGGSSDG